MADYWGTIIAILVALAGGAGGAELIRSFREWRAGIAGRHQRELTKLGDQLAASDAAKSAVRAELKAARDAVVNAQRRERIATEWGHRNAILAIRAGVPESEMPELNFRDNS